ncbi:three-helix bundle dimerization domain-containing protein [Geodermatophilus sp. SYSU D00703]
MTAVAEDVVPEDDDPLPREVSFVDLLVTRVARDYGADPVEVREHAVVALAAFAGARVQAFVPILVEKRVRETYRGRGPAR